MIRNAKGNTQILTTKAINTAIEGFSKTTEEYRHKAFEEHAPVIRSWTRSFTESIKRQIESNCKTGTAKPPFKKHKVSPESEDTNLDMVEGSAPASPSQILPEEELDRVYNLRIRDLQKEIRRENADFKLKWNKKQLQDHYLQVLVEKHQRQSTNPKSDIPTEVVRVPIPSMNINDAFKNVECNKETESAETKVIHQQSNFDSLQVESGNQDVASGTKMTDSRRSSTLMVDAVHCFATAAIDAPTVENFETQYNCDVIEKKNEDIARTAENDQNGTRMSIEYSYAGTSEELVTSPAKNLDKKVVLSQTVTRESDQEMTKADSKVKITEVKKGMVANVKAAYMEAVEAKKMEFIPFKSPGPSSLRKPAKQSRSPLKTLVQSGMQSTVRMLTPGSTRHRMSNSHSNLSPATKSIEQESERRNDEAPKKDKAEEAEQVESSIGKGYGQCLSSALRNMKVATPAINDNNSSSFKSQAAKASSEARKAKIEEMRMKSKTVAASKYQGPSTDTFTRCQVSPKQVSWSQGQELELLKKQSIAAQMRAKHMGLIQVATACPGVNGNIASIKSNSHLVSLAPSSIAKQTVSATQCDTAVAASQEKPEPENNYEISDKEDSDDDDSDSDSSESSKHRKRVPIWAQKDQLLPELERQFSHRDSSYIDPDELFGEVESCDLKDIFGSPKKSKYQRRTSTGIWTKDGVTAAEKMAYKREHRMRIMKQY